MEIMEIMETMETMEADIIIHQPYEFFSKLKC